MKNLTCKLIHALIITLVVTSHAFAGSQVSNEAILPIDDIAVLSKKIERYAAKHSARVFLIARVGRPANELPEGVEYTHVSFAVYSDIQTEEGKTVPGYAIYNLYQKPDKPSQSHLVVDFPMDFMAGAYVPKAGILIPSKKLQRRLLQVIYSDTYRRLHNPRYSALSNPYNDKYQNCTEHVLDVLNSAIYQTDNIEQLKLNAKEYFIAQTINIDPLKLLLAKLFKPEVKTSDHDGKIQSTTYESLVRYLLDNGLVETSDTIYL